MAKEMGLPIGKLICASNENNVLTDFIRTASMTPGGVLSYQFAVDGYTDFK